MATTDIRYAPDYILATVFGQVLFAINNVMAADLAGKTMAALSSPDMPLLDRAKSLALPSLNVLSTLVIVKFATGYAAKYSSQCEFSAAPLKQGIPVSHGSNPGSGSRFVRQLLALRSRRERSAPPWLHRPAPPCAARTAGPRSRSMP